MGRKSVLSAAAVLTFALLGALFIALLIHGRHGHREAPGGAVPTPSVRSVPDRRDVDLAAAGAKAEPAGAKLWTVAGRVMRARGRPAAGVAVRIDPPLKEMKTAGDGRFAFAEVPPGESIRLTIDEPASALRVLRIELPEAAEDLRKDLGDIFLAPAESLAVKLVGARGGPVEGGKVIAVPQASKESGESGAREADRDGEDRGQGEFVFGRLPPGNYSVTASAPGHIRGEEDVKIPREEPLILKLEEGHRIGGTVRAADGTPIEGAEMEVGEESKAKTDASGRFLFDTLSEGENGIQARAEGFVSEYKDLSTGIDDAEFWLLWEAVIAGKVVSEEDGSPVQGAEVALESSESGEQTRSAGDGRFEFKKLSPGKYEIRAVHEEFLPLKGGPFEVTPGDRIEDIVIQMKKGFSIGGKVLESPSESPMVEAEVTFRLQSQDEEIELARESSTKADGTFLVKGLMEGNYKVSAWKKGFQMVESLELFVQPDLGRLFLHLENAPPPASIAGRIVDADGFAVANAFSRLFSEHGSQYVKRTDEKGRFLFDDILPGEYRIEAMHHDHAPGVLEGIQVAPGQAIEGLEVRLTRGGTIRGRILDKMGEGIEGAGINLVPLIESRSSKNHHAISAGGGNYEVHAIPAGPYRLWVEAEDHEDPPSKFIVVADGETLEGHDFVLASGASLSGRVMDDGEKPLPGARIQVGGKEALSEGDGTFHVKGISPGWADLKAEKVGYEVREMKLKPSCDEVIVLLDRKASISGRVQAKGQEVFPPGDLSVQRNPEGEVGRTRIDATGRFQIQVPKGDYRLDASVPGFALSRVEISLKAGEKRDGIVIDLRSGGAIRGRTVRRGSGEPVGEVEVSVKKVSGFPSLPDMGASSDSGGVFILEKVPEGKVDLEASGSGLAEVTVHGIPVREGETREVTIELPPAGSIRGIVRSRGNLATEATVDANLEGTDFARSATIKREGRFEIQGLPEGEYEVSIRNRKDRTVFTEKATVREGHVTEMDIKVDGVRLSGRVTSRGSPARFAKISSVEIEKGWEGETTWADAAGDFAMDLPGAGTYLLTVSPGERRGEARIEVRVPDGVDEFRKDLDLDAQEISGTLLDAATGEPVDNAEVLALSPGFSPPSLSSIFQSLRGAGNPDESGHFTISHLAPGSYSLLVRPWDRHVPARIDGVAAGSGRELPISLERGTAVRLKIVQEGGRPIEGAWMILRDRGGDLVQLLDNNESGENGTLDLDGIRPGMYRATVGHWHHAPARFALQVPGEEREETVVLKAGGTVRVTLAGPGGEPASGASVILLDETGDDVADDLSLFAKGRYGDSWTLLRPNVPGKDGSMSFHHVPAGTYRAFARRGAARSEEVKLQVLEGQPVEASLTLSP